MILLLVFACRKPGPPPADADATAETARHTGAGTTAHTGRSGWDETAHTGFVPAGAWPTVTWTGASERSSVGTSLWLGDLDGDPVPDLLVGAMGDGGGTAGEVFRLEGLPPSGTLAARAEQRVSPGPGAWGAGVVGYRGGFAVSGEGARAVSGFELASGVTPPEAATWWLEDPGIGGGLATVSACPGVAGGDLCVASAPYPYAGEVRVYARPTAGPAGPALLHLVGDPYDEAAAVGPAADLDGDGVSDLVVGATRRGGTGEVAVVSGAAAVDGRLWDVTSATVTGRAEGDQFGGWSTALDYDGDGVLDLLVASPGRDSTKDFHGFRGPLAGARTAQDADLEDDTAQVASAGDFDGDGVGDLAMVGGGTAWIHFGPLTGDLSAPDALLRWGVGILERGTRVAVGDLDQDGADDLVVSAPESDLGGERAGAVHVFTQIALATTW